MKSSEKRKILRGLFLGFGLLGLSFFCGCDPETWCLKENETQLQGSVKFSTPYQPDPPNDGNSDYSTPDDPPDPEDDTPMNVGVDDAPEDPGA
jgi:hypothetical protein